MNRIYILGSGGFAKEVFSLIKDIGRYIVEGFVDREEKADITIGSHQVKVISEEQLNGLNFKPLLAIGVGEPSLIEKLSNRFSRFEFPNLIHPSAIGNWEDITLGRGNVITANCVFTTTIQIGSFNIFNLSCTVGHDTIIGNNNIFNPAVNISGGVTIGDANLLGVNATILQYKNIGNNSIIGASSLVTKDVADNILVLGVPAIKLKNL